MLWPISRDPYRDAPAAMRVRRARHGNLFFSRKPYTLERLFEIVIGTHSRANPLDLQKVVCLTVPACGWMGQVEIAAGQSFGAILLTS